MKHSSALQWALIVLCMLALTPFVYPALATSADQDVLQAAWEKARQAGAYHFSADILQTMTPLPQVTNVGRQSRQDALRMEGQTDTDDEVRRNNNRRSVLAVDRRLCYFILVVSACIESPRPDVPGRFRHSPRGRQSFARS
jgi:hypothetical protein